MQFIRKNKKVSIVILLFLLIFLGIGTAFGRYIYNIIDNYILETKGFYFNSSILAVNTKEYKVNNWDGVNSYDLTIDLNNRKNSLKSTEVDIEYNIEVSCSDDVVCQVNKDTSIIYKDVHTDSYQITITPNRNFESNETIEVVTSVTSTSPYKKVLSGKYIIGVETNDFSYDIEDSVNNSYMILNLVNSVPFYEVETAFGSYNVGDFIDLEEYDLLNDNDKDKCFSAIVTVKFDPNLVFLDMTVNSYLHRIDNSEKTDVIDNYEYISEYKFKVPATSSEKILFYKSDKKKDYTYPEVNSSSIIDVDVELAG